jgi:tRNA (mo5U34)-methyltransferase
MSDIDQLTAAFFAAAGASASAAESAVTGSRSTAKKSSAANKSTTAEILASHLPALQQALQQEYIEKKHGRKTDWDQAFASLPATLPSHTQIGVDGIYLGSAQDLDISQPEFRDLLMQFTPWRKGPWHLFDVHIDTEWRSDWKWQRLKPHITPLAGRSVLDIGCGNGYHLFHMASEGASLALGIDPTRLFLYSTPAKSTCQTYRHTCYRCVASICPHSNASTPCSLSACFIIADHP